MYSYYYYDFFKLHNSVAVLQAYILLPQPVLQLNGEHYLQRLFIKLLKNTYEVENSKFHYFKLNITF